MQKKYIFVLSFILVVGIIWIFITGGKQPTQNSSPLPAATSTAPITSSTQSIEATNTQGLKTYHNEQFGFEFRYPEEWSFFPNMFGSPFSKFNLIGASPNDEENGHPNPIDPALLVNIVTRNFSGRGADDQNVSDIMVDGISGQRYEFWYEGGLEIGVDLPFGQYHILLGAKKNMNQFSTKSSLLSNS